MLRMYIVLSISVVCQQDIRYIPWFMRKFSFCFAFANSLGPSDICVSKLTIIGSDNGLSPDRRQAIIWTNAGILLIGLLGTNFSEIFIEIHTFSVKEKHLKMSSGIWRPFCLGVNVLITMPLHGGFEALVKVGGAIHALETIVWKMATILSRPQCVNSSACIHVMLLPMSFESFQWFRCNHLIAKTQ